MSALLLSAVGGTGRETGLLCWLVISASRNGTVSEQRGRVLIERT